MNAEIVCVLVRILLVSPICMLDSKSAIKYSALSARESLIFLC
jgi:hypothetical protein